VHAKGDMFQYGSFDQMTVLKLNFGIGQEGQ
jgi:hypothetical protein